MQTLNFISIQNFRSCKKCDLPLSDFTPMVGYNNAGKSAVLDAICWLLQPKALTAADFNDTAAPVTVIGQITGLDESLLKLLNEQHMNAIKPCCPGGVLWVKRTQASSSAKAAIETTIWDSSNNTGKGIPTEWRSVPTGIPAAIKELFPEPILIEAMQDVPEDLGKVKAGTTIQTLLSEIADIVLKDHKATLETALDQIRDVIEVKGKKRSPKLATFDTEASKVLDDFFPGLSLRLNLQTVDIKEFFKAGDLDFFEEGSATPRKLNSLGTGAQRSIQMALLRHLSELQSRGDGETSARRRMLLVDEPELYLHPQGIEQTRMALKTLSQKRFQVVFATHSPQMIHRDDAPHTVIVRKSETVGTTTPKPLAEAVKDAMEDASHQTRVLFELGNAAQAFFSNRVLLFEGKTEGRLFPLLYERLFGRTPAADKLGMIALGGCADIGPALKVLKAMQIESKAVADLDFAFVQAGAAGFIDREKDAEVVAAKAHLKTMEIRHGVPLGDNGLPVNKKANGHSAADTWALFAADQTGEKLVAAQRAKLDPHGIWIWKEGAIEDVLGIRGKGEDVIRELEGDFAKLAAADIRKNHPKICEFFDWVKSEGDGKPS